MHVTGRVKNAICYTRFNPDVGILRFMAKELVKNANM